RHLDQSHGGRAGTVRCPSERHRPGPNRDTDGIRHAYRRDTRRVVGYRATASVRVTEGGRQGWYLSVERSGGEVWDRAYADCGRWIFDRRHSRRHARALVEIFTSHVDQGQAEGALQEA